MPSQLIYDPDLNHLDQARRAHAVRNFYRLAKPNLLRWLARELPLLAAHDVAQAVDQAFLPIIGGVVERWDFFDGAMVGKRLYGKARRVGIDLGRKARRNERKFVPIVDDATLEESAHFSEIFRHSDTERYKEIRHRIERAIALMPPKQKQVACALYELATSGEKVSAPAIQKLLSATEGTEAAPHVSTVGTHLKAVRAKLNGVLRAERFVPNIFPK